MNVPVNIKFLFNVKILPLNDFKREIFVNELQLENASPTIILVFELTSHEIILVFLDLIKA